MKKKHSNILVIYVPVNCTNVFHLIDVISQHLLKHAFKMTFNGWTKNIINSHIDIGANLHVEKKMNNLKPKFCGWLHQAWTEVKAMKLC